jgi:hypothetical protein
MFFRRIRMLLDATIFLLFLFLAEKTPLVEIPGKGVIFHTRRRCAPFAHTRRSVHWAPQTTDARDAMEISTRENPFGTERGSNSFVFVGDS